MIVFTAHVAECLLPPEPGCCAALVNSSLFGMEVFVIFVLISSKKTGGSWAGKNFAKARETVQGSFKNNIAHCNLWPLRKSLFASLISVGQLLSCRDGSAASHKLSPSEIPAPVSASRMASVREIDKHVI